MSKAQLSLGFRHYLRRITREPLGPVIYVVTPVSVIWLLTRVLAAISDGSFMVQGYNMLATQLSTHMMILFQLNGGLVLLHYLDHDFLQAMKWRLKSAPFPTHMLVFAAVGASTVFSFLQGLLVVAITAAFLKAYWGNLLVTCLVILMVSLTSQLLIMTIFLLVRSTSITETLSWVISLAMVIMGGGLFPMPPSAFFNFMGRYGTPYALARTAITAAGMFEPSTVNLWISLVGLAVSIAVLAAFVVVLGRRKLA